MLNVRVHKTLLALLAALTALLAVEGLCRSGLVKLPGYRESSFHRCNQDPTVVIKQYPPHYEIINGESGDFIRFNGYGLPGCTSPHQQRIGLCGSSYVFGQIEGEYLASLVLQKRLDSTGAGLGVLNLGDGNHGPHKSFIRAVFYDQLIGIDRMIYINDGNWERQASLAPPQLDPGAISFALVPSTDIELAINRLRGLSKLANLVVLALKSRPGLEWSAAVGNYTPPESEIPGYHRALKDFQTRWGERFLVVNISPDAGLNQKLGQTCDELGISYHETPLLIRENRLKGIGHLNRRGNAELGEHIFELLTRCGWLPQN